MRDAFLKEEREPTEKKAGHEGTRPRSGSRAAAGAGTPLGVQSWDGKGQEKQNVLGRGWEL